MYLVLCSIPCLMLTFSITCFHFYLIINGNTTIGLMKYGGYNGFNPFNIGYLYNLNTFFGGYYGLFWWLPCVIDNDTDGNFVLILLNNF